RRRSFFVCSYTPSTWTSTLSLHDALPIFRFMAMTPDQAAEAFRRSFGQEPPAGLAQLEGLTPGDFTVVARKARILGERDPARLRSEEHTSELQSREKLVCRLLLEKKKNSI